MGHHQTLFQRRQEADAARGVSDALRVIGMFNRAMPGYYTFLDTLCAISETEFDSNRAYYAAYEKIIRDKMAEIEERAT